MTRSFPITLEKVQEIERNSYPESFHHLQGYESWNDVARCYGNVSLDDLIVLSNSTSWYFMAARRGQSSVYVLDRCKVHGTAKMDWGAIYEALLDMGIVSVHGDMRETTSYKRLKELEGELRARVGLTIVEDDRYFESHHNEYMHSVMLILERQHKSQPATKERRLRFGEALPREYWDTAPDGGVPTKRGSYRYIYPSDLREPGRFRTAEDYVQACLDIDPHALALPKPKEEKIFIRKRVRGKRRIKPTTLIEAGLTRKVKAYSVKRQRVYLPDNGDFTGISKRDERRLKSMARKRTRGIERRAKLFRHLLKAGFRKIHPEDWVGKRKLFKRFVSFYQIANNQIKNIATWSGSPRLRGSHRTLAFELWSALGMIDVKIATGRAKNIIEQVLHFEFASCWGRFAPERVLQFLRRLPTHKPDARVVWSLLCSGRVYTFPVRDQKKIISLMAKTPPEDRWRLRWLFLKYFRRDIKPPPGTIAKAIKRIKAIDKKERSLLSLQEAASAFTLVRHNRGSCRSRTSLLHRRHFSALQSYGTPIGIGPAESLNINAVTRHYNDERPTPSIEWEMLPRALALSDFAFFKEYVPTKGHAWAHTFGRIPKYGSFAQIDIDTIPQLNMSCVLHVIKELQSEERWQEHLRFTAQSALEALQDVINDSIGIIAENESTIARLEKELKDKDSNASAFLKRKVAKEISRIKVDIQHKRGFIRRTQARLDFADLLKKERDNEWLRIEFDEEMRTAAVPLAIIFGYSYKGWLKRMEKRDVNLHEATHWLPTKHSPGLDHYLRTHWQGDLNDLQRIASKWNDLNDSERTLPVRELCALIDRRRFKDAEHMAFALEAGRAGVSEQAYKELETRWLKAAMNAAANNIPDVSVSLDGLTMRKVQRDDPRGVFLGIHSTCCQHPDGAASACAWHGTASVNGGFYIIEDTDGDIVAQSWTWKTGKAIVFDSIEGKQPPEQCTRLDTIYRLYELTAKAMLEQNEELISVRCGQGARYKGSASWRPPVSIAPMPRDFPKGAYADGRNNQNVIAQREPRTSNIELFQPSQEQPRAVA